MKVAVAGGAPVALATGQGSPQYMAVYGTTVHWTNATSGDVRQVATAGGTPVTLATAQKPSFIGAGSEGVYWVNDATGAASVHHVPLGGGTVDTYATGSGAFAGIAVDSPNVYFNEYTFSNWALMMVNLSGSPTAVMGYSGVGDAVAIDANAYYAYVTIESTSAVMRIPIAGFGTWGVIAGDPVAQQHHAITVDASNAYFTNANGDIVRAATDGSSRVVLATGQGDSYGIAVDSTSVYWTNPTTGSVMKLTPK
jgi:hypothetical protein